MKHTITPNLLLPVHHDAVTLFLNQTGKGIAKKKIKYLKFVEKLHKLNLKRCKHIYSIVIDMDLLKNHQYLVPATHYIEPNEKPNEKSITSSSTSHIMFFLPIQ